MSRSERAAAYGRGSAGRSRVIGVKCTVTESTELSALSPKACHRNHCMNVIASFEDGMMSMMNSDERTPTYIEFSDPRLVAIYDTVNPIDSYRDFYVALAARLRPNSIIDIGCGTGLLTAELARGGYRIVGLEPSHGLIEIARRRPGCERVQWIEGYADELAEDIGDLAIMTGHVAQFFLSDDSWQAVLGKIHAALHSGGHLAFESRNPRVALFPNWPTAAAHRLISDPVAGEIEWWADHIEREGGRVRYEIHYRFVRSGEEVVSQNELVFRSQMEITKALTDAGFSVQNVDGDWDRSPASPTSPEMIFLTVRS